MYKTLGSLAVLLFAVALTVGCGDGKTKTTGGKTPPVTVVSHGDFEVCKKCGEIEKSANCCKVKDESGKTIEICDKCKRHKGSFGCCVVLKSEVGKTKTKATP